MKVLTTVFLLVFAKATALASIDPQDLTVHRDVTSNTMIVRSTIALNATAEFRIENSTGQTIYTDSVKRGDFVNKRFPLPALPGKVYHIVVTDQLGQTILPANLGANDGYLASYDDARQYFYPRVDLRDERTLVVNYDNTSGKRVDIRIANQAGKTVFSDRANGAGVQRAYHLDQLAEGDYQLILSSRNVKEHTTAFALR